MLAPTLPDFGSNRPMTCFGLFGFVIGVQVDGSPIVCESSSLNGCVPAGAFGSRTYTAGFDGSVMTLRLASRRSSPAAGVAGFDPAAAGAFCGPLITTTAPGPG